MNRRFCPSLLALALAGCLGDGAPRIRVCPALDGIGAETRILAIGDSIFAWQKEACETIPDVVALELGRKGKNVAINGARITGGKHEITDQYERGDWDWVLLDGGGNDINVECECGIDCDATLDRLISEDARSGEIPRLVARIRRDGPRVLVHGYFELGPRAKYGFAECRPEIDELRTRQARLPTTLDGVTFVDGRDVVTVAGTPGAYAFDHVHPSRLGAHLVGELIAERIREAEADREGSR